MAVADYLETLAMVESGKLHPELLVERIIGLVAGITALTTMGEPAGALVSGITIIDPTEA